MKGVLVLISALGVLASGCGNLITCKPGSCPVGQHCVYVGSDTAPACRPACELGADAGTCPSGTSCQCGGSCAGCENCVPVCS